MPISKNLLKAKITERRYSKIKDETEFRYETEKNTLFGYAAKFNRWSEDLGGFKERIRKGAFTQTIKEADVRALFNHDPNLILGRTKSKNSTLRLFEDSTGLGYEIDLPGTTYATDLKESISRGDISQNSFAFQTVKDEWTDTEKSVTRELIEVKLFDVSPVTFPAYQDTDLKLRGLFSEMGLNYTEMMEIIIKSNRKELSEQEREEFRGYINILNNILEPLEKVVTDALDYRTLIRLEMNKRLIKRLK